MNFLVITYIALPVLYIGYLVYLLNRRKKLQKEEA